MDPNASHFDPTGQRNPYYGGYDPRGAPPGQPQPAGAEYGMYAGGYGDPNTAGDYCGAENAYYHPQGGPPESAYFHPQGTSQTAEPGFYYPKAALEPQVFGAPVSSIAYDDTYSAIFVASATQSIGSGRRWNHRASMLVTHSTTDGLLYASVAGHPEAPPSVLNSLYQSIFGMKPSVATPASRRAIPSHAHKPPYGTSDPAGPHVAGRGSYQMGINTLLPTHGYVASVSPSGVRVHAHGGLQVADHHVEGMLCGTHHPNLDPSIMTHMTVGGMGFGRGADSHTSRYQVLCMDIWQGLRIVSSYSFDRQPESTSVTALATSHSNGSILAGCSDGQIRMLDPRVRELAKLKSHYGGVVDVAVSNDGTMLASTGYGSRATKDSKSSLYSFPDPTIFVYDIRYLGRGGIPHPFAGLSGGPRHLSFLPDIDGQPSNRLLVASGQVGGGLQIIVPFEDSGDNASNFLLPQLDRNESISALCVSEDNLGLGTSQGKVLQYRMSGYENKSAEPAAKSGVFVPRRQKGEGHGNKAGLATEAKRGKQPLVIPNYGAPLPALSLEATILQTEDPNIRGGMTDKVKSVFATYVLSTEATLTAVGDPTNDSKTSFGPLATNPMVPPGRLQVSSDLTNKATHAVDFLQTVPTAHLDLDVFEDHRPTRIKNKIKKKRGPLPNPNKFLHTHKLSSIVYEESLNKTKKSGRKNRKEGKPYDDESGDESDLIDVPRRYRLTLRPVHRLAASFSHADYNQSGLLPGWDYQPTMPNAFISPVLMLLYFIPEVRYFLLENQLSEKALSSSNEMCLALEIGFLFHRIESLARFAMVYPTNLGSSRTRLGAWAPTNFISCLISMPEAEQLQILDGSPAAVDAPRRPEAFYRFLLYQIDKEMEKISGSKLMEQKCGFDFTSINEFISGSAEPESSSTRVMTVDLSYEPFLKNADTSKAVPHFGEVLQHTFCRESRLRAWNQKSKAYETIVQRKIATSLPEILYVSCACAGRKEEEGLRLWRGNEDHLNWLPEAIEIELEDSGNVNVRELIRDEKDGAEAWKEYKGTGSIPSSVSSIIRSKRTKMGAMRLRYRLDAVVSMVRDDFDRNCPQEVLNMGSDVPSGHHVLHARVPKVYKTRILTEQKEEVENLLSSQNQGNDMTLFGALDQETLQQRLDYANQRLDDGASDTEWILFNGYVVSNTVVEDARAFHVKFKEPSLVVFRAVQPADDIFKNPPRSDPVYRMLSSDVIKTTSMTNGNKSLYVVNQRAGRLPGKGDLIAFDAEFVSVQEDDSILTETGSKMTVRETRHAVARISVIDCRTKSVVFDDHVLPREPVVDYLTRFSGIAPKDLHPKQSPHHLISTQAAYLKLRCLMERGCIFVGHGLHQDFWLTNVAVPPTQIIDTVEIYHKPARRYISLRFLTNFVLKRDMQQDIHDSVEDALAAYELYQTAVELKEKGEFGKLLDSLYEFGQKTDWKVGVEEHDTGN